MINIDSVKNFSLRKTTIFNSIAQLLDYFFRRCLIIECLFEFRVEFIVICWKFGDLLNGVETFYGREKLFTGDLIIAIQVYQFDPFSDLERCFIRQQLAQSLFEFILADSWLAIGLALLEDSDRVYLPVSQQHTQFLHSLLEPFILDLFLVLLLHIFHTLQEDLMPKWSFKGRIPQLQQAHAFVCIQFQIL